MSDENISFLKAAVPFKHDTRLIIIIKHNKYFSVHYADVSCIDETKINK